MPWIPIALSAIQIGSGIIKGAKAKKDAKRLLAQRQAYQTPSEITDVLNATRQNASQGFDAQTLDFLSNNVNQSFAGSVGAATRAGADPNVLSGLFHENVNSIMRIGEENHMANMQNFSAYLNALNSVAANKAAEQKSREDMLKDSLQQVSNEKLIASQQISEGINTGLSAAASYMGGNLYGDTKTDEATFTKAYGNNGPSAYAYARQNGLSFSQYDKLFKKLKKAY